MHISTPIPKPSSAPATTKWRIQPVTSATVDEVTAFINTARHDMFPTLHSLLADDISRWISSGSFLVALDATTGHIIATIGYVPYDHRFPHLVHLGHLKQRNMRVVEVVRLYVLPAWRKAGLGAELFEALKRQAVEEEVECLYLHTHPFLDGAVRFWEKRGFEVVDVEVDPVWRTTHMQMVVGEMEGGSSRGKRSC
ncbi:acyl-CoA N-acyltransferase [Bimuria novae-zelandiae CBS 107.79]|uniref:Acyl-CoA N-acyltransferase n=1 Tax=Bimuria novae-zelandiae CBS 107.79 TaxID=1447943 RepID=A0A6A5URE1_9PLEO|nr:acyl-CoA N-acyltransferase [Bimuria novae-zelandiae CBS 107.79]